MSQVGTLNEPIQPAANNAEASARWAQGIVLGALLLAVFWNPITDNLIPKWTNDPNWSHGWLIPLFSLFFLYQRRDELAAAPRRTEVLGIVILALALAAYFVFAVVFPRAYLRTAALIPAIFGVTLALTGWTMTRIAAFPILFLLLAVPLPQGLYVDLTLPLRQLATLIASLVLPLIPGVEIELGSGTVIDYFYYGEKGSLNVEEACSGMRSLMTIITLGFLLAYLGDRPMWQRFIMVASCIPIALSCNALRVVLTGILYISGHKDLARGSPHALLGMLMLLPAWGMYWLVGFVLDRLFVEDANEAVEHVPTV